MSYRVRLDGQIECDTLEEALAYLGAIKPRTADGGTGPVGLFERTLRALCDEISPMHHPGRGPKPIPVADIAYACAMRVRFRTSARNTEGGVHYNTLLQAMGSESFATVLGGLIDKAATRAKGLKPIRADYGAYMHKGLIARQNEEMLRRLVDMVSSITWPEAA